jgi:hypothetical protein
MKRCWDIKSCPFCETDPVDSRCPAYATQTPCWNYDWLSFYRAMPDGSEKAEWRRTMLEWCASCAVRKKHGEKIDAFMEKLRSA